RGGAGAAATVAPAGMALLDGGCDLRGRLHPARHRAAALPAPRGLLHQEPRVRHRARADGARVCAEDRIERRYPPHVGVVQAGRVAVMVMMTASSSQLPAPSAASETPARQLSDGAGGRKLRAASRKRRTGSWQLEAG